MLWLIFRSVLCINYKIVHNWVYYYEETIDRAFIEQRFGHDNLECEMTLENPFEKKLLESSVKSSFTEIKKEKNTIFFRFTFDTYKNFEFLKNGHKKSLFFTEFNFNPSTTINRKLMLQKIAKTKREKGEAVEDKIEEKIDCEPKLLSGFLFVNEVKNLKRESKMADYFYYGRFAPLRGFRLMESIFLQRIVNFIDHLKAFPDYRIQPVVESMEEEIFASRRKKNPFKKLQLALVDLLSVMSKNRKLKNLGITFDNPDVYIKRNPVLEEFANENFSLVKKLEEFYDIYFADSVEATHDHYPRLDLRGVRCLTKDTTCYFQMFDMLSYMDKAITSCVKLPFPRKDPCPILAHRNNPIFNQEVRKDHGVKIEKTKLLNITITDEDTKKPCDKDLKVLIHILHNKQVIETVEIDYGKKFIYHDFTKTWPSLADDVRVEVKGQ